MANFGALPYNEAMDEPDFEDEVAEEQRLQEYEEMLDGDTTEDEGSDRSEMKALNLFLADNLSRKILRARCPLPTTSWSTTTQA